MKLGFYICTACRTQAVIISGQYVTCVRSKVGARRAFTDHLREHVGKFDEQNVEDIRMAIEMSGLPERQTHFVANTCAWKVKDLHANIVGKIVWFRMCALTGN